MNFTPEKIRMDGERTVSGGTQTALLVGSLITLGPMTYKENSLASFPVPVRWK